METAKVQLFSNERESNARSSAEVIEDVLTELGYTPSGAAATPAEQTDWSFVHGSALVLVSLIHRDDYVHLRVVAPVLTRDSHTDPGALFSRLLELNASDVVGAAFAVRGREVQIVCERSTIDLDRSEVKDMISRVSRYADAWDDRLVEEFGGARGRV